MPTKNPFTLCSRTHLKEHEKQILIDNRDKLNKEGENLLHCYIKNAGRIDVNLVQDMIDNRYDTYNVNKEGHSIFYSCFNNWRYKTRFEVIDLLIKNKCPLDSPNMDLTQFILHDNVKYQMEDKYFELIEKLLDLGLLETDLKNKYPHINPAKLIKDIYALEWFDNIFSMNYDIEGLLPFLAAYRQSPEMFEYICRKNQSVLNLSDQKYKTKLLEDILMYNNYQHLEILYKYSGEIDDADIIQNFVDKLVKNSITPCRPKVSYFRFSLQISGYERKRNLIWLVLNNKLQKFSIRLIKGFRITLDDFKNFPKVSEYTHGQNISHNYELFFEEDCLEVNDKELEDIQLPRPKYVKTLKEMNQKFGLEDYTKEYCQNLYDQIMNLP